MRIILYFITSLLCLTFKAQIRNLVLEGGGVRGIAYVGAIKALEEHQMLDSIENVAGTSVGAITATMISLGYSSNEIRNELASLKIQKFNDGKGIFIGGIHRTKQHFGWYKGDELTNWIEDLIFYKTGDRDLTFIQLNELSDSLVRFKDLYIAVTNLSQQRSMIINHKNYPNMRIADAVRMSASIPIYYTAIFMDQNGQVYSKPPKDTLVDVIVDGGFLTNYPIHTFDDNFSLESTLGLRLDEQEQIDKDHNQDRSLVHYSIEDPIDYIQALYNLVIENLNRNNLTESDWNRTISISTCGIGPKVKRLKDEEINSLIQSGYQATNLYLSDY
ncbi:MAG: patatin-like phospholipase family protein [Flavobacteriales bacterium]|nr:patatin-like phospholipase family protein [Flavobacteriales bacterium]MCB9197239.1 patatin-like phospholipase family protein [Flavobacteriales bacterium]